MKLDGKNIILTGAASGIGKAVLTMLASHPAKILAVDLNTEALNATCNELAGKVAIITPYVCDLTAPENVDKLFSDALEKLGSIDIFIANAGFAYFEKIEYPDWSHIEKIFRINVFSALYAFEKMQTVNKGRENKTIITASAMAHIGVPGYAIYSGTKAALDRFADAHRWQMDDPRQLMLVYPIGTRTGFFQAAGDSVPIPWPNQTAEAVASAILRGIERDAQRVYPSLTFQLILLLKRFLPMHRLVQYLEQRRFSQWIKKNENGGS